MFVFAPLLILFLAAQLGPGWRLIRFSLLGLSFLCYALRIGLTQFRQQQDRRNRSPSNPGHGHLRRRHGILNEKGLHVYANNSFARMLGFESPASIIGQPWRVIYALQEMDRLEPEIRRSLAQAGNGLRKSFSCRARRHKFARRIEHQRHA